MLAARAGARLHVRDFAGVYADCAAALEFVDDCREARLTRGKCLVAQGKTAEAEVECVCVCVCVLDIHFNSSWPIAHRWGRGRMCVCVCACLFTLTFENRLSWRSCWSIIHTHTHTDTNTQRHTDTHTHTHVHCLH